MDDAQYRYVVAALSVQDLMIRALMFNGTLRLTDKGFDDFGASLKKALMSMSVPPGVAADEGALAVQREALSQFDVAWSRVRTMRAERRSDMPGA